MAPGLSQLHFLSLFFFFHQEVAFGNAASGIQREREREGMISVYITHAAAGSAQSARGLEAWMEPDGSWG